MIVVNRSNNSRKKNRRRGKQPARANSELARGERASSSPLRHLGVGIDTARYGHHVSFLREDKELATLVSDIKAGWVVDLLTKYPTAQKIAAARLNSLEKIPFLKPEKAAQVHEAAKHSVAAMSGEVAEELIRELVNELKHSLAEEARWRKLLEKAFEGLPEGSHQQIATIKGIGKQTAAADQRVLRRCPGHGGVDRPLRDGGKVDWLLRRVPGRMAKRC